MTVRRFDNRVLKRGNEKRFVLAGVGRPRLFFTPGLLDHLRSYLFLGNHVFLNDRDRVPHSSNELPLLTLTRSVSHFLNDRFITGGLCSRSTFAHDRLRLRDLQKKIPFNFNPCPNDLLDDDYYYWYLAIVLSSPSRRVRFFSGSRACVVN